MTLNFRFLSFFEIGENEVSFKKNRENVAVLHFLAVDNLTSLISRDKLCYFLCYEKSLKCYAFVLF